MVLVGDGMVKVVMGVGMVYLFDDVKYGGISFVEVVVEELLVILLVINL